MQADTAPPVPPVHASPQPAADRLPVRAVASIFAAVSVVCVLAYLAYAVPGAWFPRAPPLALGVSGLTLTRGSGELTERGLVVSKPDASGLALVSAATDFRAPDYPAIDWQVSNLAEGADVRLLWRSDYRPDRLNSVKLRVEAGRTLPALLAGNPAWFGRITGLALAIHDPLAQPANVVGVVADPMGAADVLRARASEWLAFERWNGASINTITGGADVQALPLPVLLGAVALLCGAGVLATTRRRPVSARLTAPALAASFFLLAWLVLDARWTWNLMRQERATALQYWGKDARERKLAGDDAVVYAFVEKALRVLPKEPARVVVAADADYFRGRAAYHLYPHSVYFSPRGSGLPRASELRSGDWLLVFLRRGIQFDRANETLRWDGDQTAKAELKLVEPGAALFLVR